MTRIVVAGGGTGGHLYPGLAIARALVKARPSIEPFFIGARRGIERDVFPQTEFPHVLLDLHPLYRSAVWNNWRTIVGAMSAWRAIGELVRRDPPAVILGTGGYAAAITLAYGVVHRIPIVQQIGDVVPGLTARGFSRWTREAYLNFPEAARVLTAHHDGALVDTGMPIEPPPVPRPDRRVARERWGFPRTAGRAARLLRQPGLARCQSRRCRVGRPGSSGRTQSCSGPPAAQRTPTSNISKAIAFACATINRRRARPTPQPISRSRAPARRRPPSCCAWGIPAVLVPLPTAAADHQTTNAAALAAAGAAIHVPQSQLTAQRLDETVRGLVADPAALARLVAGAAKRARPDAAAEIATRILAVIDGARS